MINWQRVSGIVWRHFYLLPRSFDRLTDTFFWPVLDVLVWGLTAQWLAQKDAAAQSLVLSILTSFVMWRMVWFSNYEVSINLVEESWNRNFTNMLSTPLTKLEWLIGNLGVGLLKLAVAVAITALTILFAYSMNIFALGWIWVPLTTILIVFGWAIGLIASATILLFGVRAQALSWTLAFVFLPLCAAYAPVSMLPSWVQLIAHLFPATYAFEAMREAVLQGRENWSLVVQGLALSAAFLALGILAVHLAFERARRLGFDHLE